MSASREKKLRKETKAGGAGVSGKERQERQDAFRRRVTTTIVVVLLVALVVLILSGSGIMQANMTVLTIDGVKIKGAEFDYHYYDAFFQLYNFYATYYDYYDWIDPDKSFKRQDAGGGMTWAEYFEEMATENLTLIVAQSEAAKREGISLTDEDREKIDENVAYMEYYAQQENLSVDRFLRNNYGRGITLKSYRAILERVALSERYRLETVESFGWSEDDIQKHYEENREEYDLLDFHIFVIDGTPADLYEREEEYTEEELAAYKEERRAKAEEMRSRITTSDAFYELSLEYTEEEPGEDTGDDTGDDTGEDTNDDTGDDTGEDTGDGAGEDTNEDTGEDTGEEPEEDAEDTTLVERYAASSLSGDLADYLLDNARKNGDTAVVEEDDGFYVVLFLDRYRDDTMSYDSVDVRHLLIKTDGYDTAGDAREEAERLLRLWKDGAADEDYFAELVGEYTTDDGSKSTGGLYTGITSDSGYVKPFEDWAIDPARKPGDTGIVEVEDWYHGFHIMYFVKGYGSLWPEWKKTVKSALDQDAYQEHQEGLTEGLEAKRHSLGMMFTKTRSS